MSTVIETEDNTTGRISVSNVPYNTTTLRRSTLFRQELINWVQLTIAYLFFFILFQVTVLINSPPDAALIPLFAFDIKNLVFLYCSKKYPKIIKAIFSYESINQICSLVFKILVLVHKNSKSFNALLLIAPVGISVLGHFVYRVSKSEECRYLTWLIITICKILFLLTILNFSLSEEKLIDWERTAIIWPVYIGLCICGILILGLILIAIGTFFSWINEDVQSKELISTIWLLFTLLGAAFSILTLVSRVIDSSMFNLGKFFCLVPIVFLSTFLTVTLLNLKNLVEWWINFFCDTSIDSIDIEQPSNETVVNTSVLERIEPCVKKPPHLLIRISSSYFRPVSAAEKKNACRTVSFKDELNHDNEVKRRTFSGPCTINENGIGEGGGSAESSLGKLCEMCCDRICNAVVMECGHGGICYECCLEMWKATGQCHMCRSRISQVLQIENRKEELVKVTSTTRAVYYESK